MSSSSIALLSLVSVVVATLASQHAKKSTSDLRGRSCSSSRVMKNMPPKEEGFIVVTRVHTISASAIADPVKVCEFVDSVLEYAAKVVICIGIGSGSNQGGQIDDYVLSVRKLMNASQLSRVIFLSVVPWGRFTSPLNAALVRAMDEPYSYIAFQSLEFRMPAKAAVKLLARLKSDSDILVAGPAISGHEFAQGAQSLRGRSCPWNTFAIWSLPFLTLTGFPMIGDGHGPCAGGVEEVSAISLLQHINPQLKALLVRLPGIEWNTTFEDTQRAQWHERKMSSKNERPARQLDILGVKGGVVHHVDDE